MKLSSILLQLQVFMFDMNIRGFFSSKRSKKSFKKKGGHDSEGETAKSSSGKRKFVQNWTVFSLAKFDGEKMFCKLRREETKESDKQHLWAKYFIRNVLKYGKYMCKCS